MGDKRNYGVENHPSDYTLGFWTGAGLTFGSMVLLVIGSLYVLGLIL